MTMVCFYKLNELNESNVSNILIFFVLIST